MNHINPSSRSEQTNNCFFFEIFPFLISFFLYSFTAQNTWHKNIIEFQKQISCFESIYTQLSHHVFITSSASLNECNKTYSCLNHWIFLIKLECIEIWIVVTHSLQAFLLFRTNYFVEFERFENKNSFV
jgi:hypothetical protein